MNYFKLLLVVLFPALAAGQNPLYIFPSKQKVDSMRLALEQKPDDTNLMAIYKNISVYYLESNRDSCIYFSGLQLSIARKFNLNLWQAYALHTQGYALWNKGKYIQALQAFLESIKIAEDKESEKNIWQISEFHENNNPHFARLNVLAMAYHSLGHLYGSTGNIEKQISSYRQTIFTGETINDPTILSLVNMNLGETFYNLNKLDSSLILSEKALDYSNRSGFFVYKGLILTTIGNIYTKKEKYLFARGYFFDAISISQKQNNPLTLAWAYVSAAGLFRLINEPDSSLIYARLALENYKVTNTIRRLPDAYIALSSAYKLKKDPVSALHYFELANEIKDSLNNAEQIKNFENIGFNEVLRMQELEKERVEDQTRIRNYGMLAGIIVFMIIISLLYKNNRNRKKANTILEKQKNEIEEQKRNVEETLTDLKSTQAQLIQSEKMASLGELTAGIAHEIQNPLNFVNNFSEVSNELLDEMKSGLATGNMQLANEIADDIKQNLEKINHHGKRADAIVKGMLQHSRTSSGQKEPTDINALADEYLRLSYHGLRAKDKSFNATMKTDFDDSIGNINIIPQDIGRVILNLINNAFYAVDEKKKRAGNGYEPTATVTTKKQNGMIEIKVKDNGNGIPQKVLDKIFQPFFTTKPTGQGTGLGLSLAYDIVTKGHGGELKVETKEGEGSEFIIQLPVNQTMR